MQDSFVLLNETVHTVVVNGLIFCYVLLTIFTLILPNEYSHDTYKCNLHRT